MRKELMNVNTKCEKSKDRWKNSIKEKIFLHSLSLLIENIPRHDSIVVIKSAYRLVNIDYSCIWRI